MKLMSDQLSFAAFASVAALAALCFGAPALESQARSGSVAPVAAMADIGVPAIAPSLFRR